MPSRVVSVNDSFDPPAKVSERLAERLADPSTPEGAAVKKAAAGSVQGGATIVVYDKFADAPALPAGTIVLSRSGT